MININFDKEKMLETTLNFYSQLKNAAKISKEFHFDVPRVDNVVICGMGGSAIGGDITRSLLLDEIGQFVFVNKDYEIPQFVNEMSLVVISSYSGNTEEVIKCYEQAAKRTVNIVFITSDGELEKIANENRIMVFKMPEGFQPRSALAYSVVALLKVLSDAGLIHDKTEDINAASVFIKELCKMYGPTNKEDKNLPFKLAERLLNKIPLIYAPSERYKAIADRWKTQFNENSEIPAFTHSFPELTHNEIMGYNSPELNENFFVILLRNVNDDDRIKKRIDITKEMIEKSGTETFELNGIGDSLLKKVLFLIYVGDLTSIYLALMYKKNPASIDKIKELKKKMS